MAKTWNALDNEFAVSSGSNVNSTPGRSDFDYPPSSSINLVIISNDGDPDPKTFSLGDTYDISWDGNGGGGSIEDATVVRSDEAPAGGGLIVFEGLDQNGELVQVIWTPDFDLESWYWDSFNGGVPPQFYVSDQNSSYTHTVVCFEASMPISTPRGHVAAGLIRAGQSVCTLDGGHQPVLWTGHMRAKGVGAAAPVRFAPGTIGNSQELIVSQQHRILVRSPLAELLFASHEVLVPAKAMLGEPGVTLQIRHDITYVHLLLARHHILNAAGAPCESLFMGTRADLITAGRMSAGDRHRFGEIDHVAARPMLTYRESRCIVGTRLPEPCSASI
ncbi:Hint domain-containing protein [Roseovarius faecimaris]|uniref:Hint domain-containing protein n=1 Tax=Roseovarius faecimaris TaxID=2494550 RepID=A0A6I6IJ57_9RHOB|nr:Hint domain-containing protein [Roseovarius faecimaris]QGX96859.1 Hint domain-containing protein [Roseovarius faecimaris]